MVHRYCKIVLNELLKRVKDLQKYQVYHRPMIRYDTWLFKYRGYQKLTKGCCCKYSAASTGFIYWLERNCLQRIKRLNKKCSKSYKVNAK